MTLFVGIDPGQTNLALVAINEKGDFVDCAKPTDLPIKGVQRLCFLMIFVKDFVAHLPKKEPVKQFCMEGYSNAERFGREASGETGATIKLALVGWYGLGDPLGYPTIVAPGQLKQFTTGKGNTPKDQLRLFVYKRWGFEHKDQNIIEAYALAKVSLGLHTDPVKLTAYETKVIGNLRGKTEWSPNWDFKKLMGDQKRSSTLAGSLIPEALLPSSLIPSTKENPPSSEPSVLTRSTRRLKRASSPATTPSKPGTTVSSSRRRLVRRSTA